MLRNLSLHPGPLLPGLLLLGLSLPTGVAAQPDPNAAARASFVQALAAVPRGLPAEDDPQPLRDYLLYPYLQAERLQWQLSQATEATAEGTDAAIGAFLAQYGDAPWTRALRVAWLKDLAERQQWPQFAAYYLEARADTLLRCHELNALIATGASAALVEPALAIWRSGAELPPACTGVFDWLKAENALSVEAVAARTRLALEAGKPALARPLIRELPETQREGYQRWADMLEEPARHLERGIATGAEPRAIIDSFAKLARADADKAAEALARIGAACSTVPAPAGDSPCALQSPATVGEMRREIALNLAWSRRPETVDMFRLVPEAALDERAHEWRVRAALWSGQWAQAASWIAQMPAALQEQPRWRYWRGRTAEKLDRRERATAEYQKLAQENGYYAVLASERLGRAYAPRTLTRPGDVAARGLISSMPGVVRAREAWLVDQQAWARSEWNEATGGFDAARLLEAARIASSWGWHLMAVATATRAEVFDDFALLYPRPYQPELVAAARRADLPAEWVWGVLRQESLYDPRARSSANALGLLQLLPATARAVARRNGFDAPSEASLYEPQTNLKLGTTYLREQFDTFGGRFVLVLGAYNAGPNAVRRWLPDEPMETDVWIENVPFNETRNYIQRIVWHSTVFAWEASRKPQRITPWLVPISSDLTRIARD